MPTNHAHMNDEHMRLYQWNDTGIGMASSRRSKRTHPWHASYAVLAVLTSLLLLSACEKQGPAEQAGAQVDQAVQDMQDKVEPLYDESTQAGPAEETGRALDEAREAVDEKIGQAGEALQKQ